MAVVATINTNFTATTGELEKGTKRVQQAVKNTVAGITAGTFANISSAISAVRGLVAFQIGKSLIGAFTGGLKALDIGEAARNLGLAPDSLQSLSFAADQSGSSAAALQTALVKMSDTIADAANGGEESQKAFSRLGLDFKKLRSQDVETNFLQIADAMSKASDATARVGAARDIFGRGGVSLITTLSDGAKGITKLQQEFHRLHGTVGELGFASVDAANDALQRAGVAFTGLKNTVLVSATPGITLFADSLSSLVAASHNAAESQFALSKAYLEFSKGAGDWMQQAFIWHAKAEAKIQGLLGFGDNAKIFADAAAKADGAAKASDLLQQDWARILADMDAVKKRSKALRDAGGAAGAVEAANKGKEIKPAAVERGSKEAFDIIADSIRAAQAPDAAGKQDLIIQKEQLRELEAVNRNLEKAPKIMLEPARL